MKGWGELRAKGSVEDSWIKKKGTKEVALELECTEEEAKVEICLEEVCRGNTIIAYNE